MARLKVLLYSKQKTQRIVYDDQDGIMTTEIEKTFLRKCEVLMLRNGGAKINVSDKTKNALAVLQTKYDNASRYHIRKLLGFLKGLSEGEYFYYLMKTKPLLLKGGLQLNACNWRASQKLFL